MAGVSTLEPRLPRPAGGLYSSGRRAMAAPGRGSLQDAAVAMLAGAGDLGRPTASRHRALPSHAPDPQVLSQDWY